MNMKFAFEWWKLVFTLLVFVVTIIGSTELGWVTFPASYLFIGILISLIVGESRLTISWLPELWIDFHA